MLLELTKHRPVRVLLSLLWGFALSMLFWRTCSGKRCTTIAGPPMDVVRRSTYDFGAKAGCFTFTPHLVPCDDPVAVSVTVR